MAASEICAFMMSEGRSMWTGPMRPLRAMPQPLLTASGICFTSSSRKLCLVMGIISENTSASWKALFPIIPVGTCPVRTIIGDESAYAVATPVTRLVAPGPDVARHTPGRPVERA